MARALVLRQRGFQQLRVLFKHCDLQFFHYHLLRIHTVDKPQLDPFADPLLF